MSVKARLRSRPSFTTNETAISSTIPSGRPPKGSQGGIGRKRKYEDIREAEVEERTSDSFLDMTPEQIANLISKPKSTRPPSSSPEPTFTANIQLCQAVVARVQKLDQLQIAEQARTIAQQARTIRDLQVEAAILRLESQLQGLESLEDRRTRSASLLAITRTHTPLDIGTEAKKAERWRKHEEQVQRSEKFLKRMDSAIRIMRERVRRGILDTILARKG